MASVDITYLASGFHEDCIQLLEIFKNKESIRFEEFCEAWKEMQFSLVFLCRRSYLEMLEFCEEVLNIAKQFLLIPSELIDQVAGLYLLYGLYYKIPLDDVRIRVTLQEWKIFLNIHKQIKEQKLYDASYIFVKLVTDNAFNHCLFSTEYGLEKYFKTRQEHSFENPHSLLPTIIDEVENGELVHIRKLSKVYDDQKTKLINNLSSKNKLQLFDKNFMEDVVSEIETLQEKRETFSGLRKKVKEIPIGGKPERVKYSDDRIRPKLGHGFDTDSSDDENMELQFNFVKSDPAGLPDIDGDEDDDDDDDDDIRNIKKKEDDDDEDENDDIGNLISENLTEDLENDEMSQ